MRCYRCTYIVDGKETTKIMEWGRKEQARYYIERVLNATTVSVKEL